MENKKRKIAFVSDAVMPWHMGGKERRLWEISRRLVGGDSEVHIYTMQWWSGPKTIVQDGIHYHAICKLHPLYSEGRRSIAEAIFFALATFKLLFVRFDVLDVDHIPFFPLFSARVVTWLRGKKMYATWHEVWGRDYWLEYMGGVSGYFGYCVERLSFMLPDTILSISEHTTQALRQAGVKQTIRTITLGADLDSIYAAKPSGMQSDIIFVGRLLDHKGVALLVQALAFVKESLPDVKLLIIGSGPERKNIDTLVAKLQLQQNVTILNAVERHEDLYGLMKSSKMLVLPSIREGFGLVVVEANAAGIPVITTSHKHNAAKELIREAVNGIVVEPTAQDIAAKILYIMDNRSRMTPKKEIERFDWKVIVQQIEKAFA